MEVRVYKTGGSSRHYLSNKSRKCARCLRFSPTKEFSGVTLDDLVPVTIEQDGDQERRHKGICQKCLETIDFVNASSNIDRPKVEELN